MAERDCFKHPQVRPLEESVSSRIEALLARADGLMTGKEYHVLFDARGERHARQVAARDAAVHRGPEPPAKPPRKTTKTPAGER
jgi:hypothetical protein